MKLPSALRSAFTLVEMLMVLFILALLTVVAVQSVDVALDQERIDFTYASMKQIKEAIAGQPGLRAADGSVLIAGYVADMGALPNSLDDLVNPPANAPVYALHPFPVPPLEPQVTIPGGWNGPYLRLPPGAIRPVNAWGHDLALVAGNIVSLGADNSLGGVGPNADSSEAVGLVTGGLAGQITTLDGMGVVGNPKFDDGNTVSVYLLRPTPNQASPVVETLLETIALDSTYDGTKPVAYSQGNLFIGPRVVYAVQRDGTTVNKKSPFTRVMLRPTAQIQHLTLQ